MAKHRTVVLRIRSHLSPSAILLTLIHNMCWGSGEHLTRQRRSDLSDVLPHRGHERERRRRCRRSQRRTIIGFKVGGTPIVHHGVHLGRADLDTCLLVCLNYICILKQNNREILLAGRPK